MTDDEIKTMRRTADFERKAAVRSALREIGILRDYLDSAERDVKAGASPGHQALNMGQHLAKLSEAAGKLDALRALDEFLFPKDGA